MGTGRQEKVDAVPEDPQPPSAAPRRRSDVGSPPGPRAPRLGVVSSVGLLVVGALATVGLLVAAFAAALCGLGGDDAACAEESRLGGLALVSAAVVFLGVPVLVATLRRDGRWLLVPVVEVAAVVALVVANDVL